MSSFFPSCTDSKFPIFKKKRFVVGIPKPIKSVRDPKSYRLISFASQTRSWRDLSATVSNQLLIHYYPKSRLVLTRKTTVDQIILLTENIEGFFVNLTAAYDIVWHCGFTCEKLRLLSDKHIIRHITRMIMKLVQKKSFTFTTCENKQSIA